MYESFRLCSYVCMYVCVCVCLTTDMCAALLLMLQLVGAEPRTKDGV